jgi:putative transposase
VKFRLSVPWAQVEESKSCRVTIDRAGRWHVSFPSPQPELARTATGATVGIDRGVTNTFATSDGGFEHIPTLRPKGAERVLRLERKLARQARGSNRREQTRVAKAKIIARGTDRRTNWIEQTTTYLVREYDLSALESLAIKNMTTSAKGTAKNPGTNVAAKSALTRAILDANWGKFEQRLRDKASTCGVLVISVPARNTSRRCAACGHTSAQNRESQSVFACRACGHEAHADTNASLNIHERALAMFGLAGGSPVTGRGDLSLDGSTNREALTSD